jgi:hypothetical protein
MISNSLFLMADNLLQKKLKHFIIKTASTQQPESREMSVLMIFPNSG